jgi:hypothetical protein
VSRSFLGFLLFCLLLVAATAGVVWYVRRRARATG